MGVPVNVADRPALCDFILPAIVDRDEIVVAISTGGASPSLATVLRGRIEAALPERLGAVARLAATFRAQVNALIGEPARRRAFFRRLVEGPAARLALAGDEAGARRAALGELDSAAAAWRPRASPYRGCGTWRSGSPDLARGATAAGGRRHPARRSRAASILARARRDAELVPVGKRASRAMGAAPAGRRPTSMPNWCAACALARPWCG